MKQFDLENRLIAFSCMVINAIKHFPSEKAATHLAGQLLRSGTSPALNYGEAQAAESTADFLHKHRIVLKELRESQINLKILGQCGYLPQDVHHALLGECSQLVAIFTKSIETIKKNQNGE